ncbi:MAG: efflux transporter periplasmic adaptor subunit, partial [Polaromonas sp.]|nr:efflux transporter periplasmic adaptor subunit [Polaromonas sp.]
MPKLSLIKPYSSTQQAQGHARLKQIVLVVWVGLTVVACGKGGSGAGPGAGAAPPPAEVGVVTVSQGDVGLVTELP